MFEMLTLRLPLLSAIVAATCALLPAASRAQTPTVAPTPEAVAYGLYMARIADCMACHTQQGGTPYAGGRMIGTPFGSISSPNITPDPDTGIGRWTDAQFYDALHDGIGHSGEYLYPVMPFDSYTRMTREDALAIKRYLLSLKPVYAPRAPNDLAFPFDIRASMIGWRLLYFTEGTFVPSPDKSADWNRGAYLVRGPGHCGACHSPRTILGGTETAESLGGGDVGSWIAPNISSDKLAGLGDWKIDDIVAFLKGGSTSPKGVAFGPMGEVVHDSLRYATDADVRAIAVYLKDGPNRAAEQVRSDASKASLARGKKLYADNCAECHQDNGRGIPGAVPNLAGNAAVQAPQPNDVILAMLNGLQGTGTYGQMPRFAGALGDAQITDIANYVRSGFGNTGVADSTPALVAQLRGGAATGLGGTEAARAFDCPAIGSGAIVTAAASPQNVATLAGAGNDLSNRLHMMIAQMRQEQPGIGDAAIANTLNASYCPVVANMSGLGYDEKRARLYQFNAIIQDDIASTAAAAATTTKVVEPVTVSKSLVQQIGEAAAKAHETTSQWIAETLARGTGPAAPAK